MGVSERGAVVAGYRIESLLGRGGMGVVYRARDPQLGRDVALKVIAPELVADADVRARFLREARAAAAIEHPNVIPVHAAGERDGVAFLAMRLVDGDDLRARVRREGPPAIEDACALIEQAASGLDAIHRAGFIHRDVKPGNLLVDRSGHVYLTDFGLAKQLLTSSGATRTGRWVGTLDYIAPEQLRGGRVDARADVYALGGVLHYVLTGQVPFERDHDEAKLWAQLSEPPPQASTTASGIDPAFDPVLRRALAKRPEERQAHAGELGDALLDAVAGRAPPREFRTTGVRRRSRFVPPRHDAETEPEPERAARAAPSGPDHRAVLVTALQDRFNLAVLGLLLTAGIIFGAGPAVLALAVLVYAAGVARSYLDEDTRERAAARPVRSTSRHG
jgi:serine/threonine protein kinase